MQVQNAKNKINFLEYLVLFAVIFFTFYYGFSAYALENMNEGLYAEVAREMLVTGNYIIPQLNFVPYLEKPPLLYWLIAIDYHLFGISEFSARLIPVTAGALTCLSVFLFAKKLNFERVGWFSALILATSAGFILIARVIIFDMTLTLFFILSLMFFYLWYIKEKRYYLYLSYFNLALAFMTKGMLPLFLMPCIAVLFMLWNKTQKEKIYRSFDSRGIIIFLCITIPWIIIASFKQTDFFYDFFINEQILRFFNHRIPHDYHTGTIFYYVMPFFVIMLPWTFSFPIFIYKKTTYLPEFLILRKFLWCFFLIPIIFFSISQAKAAYYIIIAIPALALLLGIKLYEYNQNMHNKTLLLAFVITIIMLCSLLFFVYLSLTVTQFANLFPDNWIFPKVYQKPIFQLLFTTFFYSIIIIFCSIFFNWEMKKNFLAIAFLIIPWIFAFIHDKQRLEPVRSEIFLANYILQHHPEYPVYLYKDYEDISSILYYLKKRLFIIDSQSKDLYFGASTTRAKGWFITNKEFIEQIKQKNVYIVMKAKYEQEFLKDVSPLQFCSVAKSANVLLLTTC